MQAVLLTLGILEALASSEDARGVTELAQALNVNKSRIFRHLRTLVEAGYAIKQPGTDRYRTGPSLRRLSSALSDVGRLIDASHLVMKQVAEDWGCTVVLSLVSIEGIRVIHTVSSRSLIEVSVKVGYDLPLHATAQGKVLLAFEGEKYWHKLREHPLPQLTPFTVCDIQELERQARLTRDRRWAASPHETSLGTNGIAAPIFRSGVELVGTVGMVQLIEAVDELVLEKQGAAILAAANQISDQLV